jgi:LuxR family maltose regulon positive regulatory protein
MPRPRRGSLLQVKLNPPGISSRSIHRVALLEHLRELQSAGSLLLDAPAGYGKTTLMVQYFHALQTEGVRLGWLSLDAHDNDPDGFGRYLRAAFANAGIRLAEDGDAVDAELHAVAPRTVLNVLLNRLSEFGRTVVLFVDDLHVVTAPECLALARLLIADAPANLRLIAASRGRPNIDTTRFEVQGALTVLSEQQIRFGRDEAASLLGPQYSDEIVRVLTSRTNGWPVALQLIRASAPRSREALQQMMADMSNVPDVASYLTEQVLSTLSADVREFLMLTSLPERISGDLANELCRRADGWNVLEGLERDSLFIAPVTGEPGWYRYYDFFRDFLNQRAAREPGMAIRDLHRRAARWFLEHGHLREALRHGVDGADWEVVVKILEEGKGWHIALQHGSGILRGIEAVPEAAIGDFLFARLTLIYMYLHSGQIGQARLHFDRLCADSDDITLWRGTAMTPTMKAECHSLECILLVCEDKPIPLEYVERIKREVAEQGSANDFIRALAESNLTIYANYDAGRYRDCIRLAEEALPALRNLNATFGLGYLYLFLGRSHFVLGNLKIALTYYRKTYDLATRHFPNEPQRLEALAFMAEVQYEQNDLETAQKNIRSVLDGLGNDMELDSSLFHPAYLTAATLYARRGDLDGALSLLMEGRAFARFMHRDRRLAYIEIKRVEELTRAGYLDDAGEIIAQGSFQKALAMPRNSFLPLLFMDASLAVARFDLRRGDVSSARARLESLWSIVEPCEHELLKGKCRMLLGVARYCSGAIEEGVRALSQVLALSQAKGLVRLVLDEAALVRPVLEHILRGGDAGGGLRETAKRILDSDGAGAPAGEPPATEAHAPGWSVPSGILSPRERDVLELLADGLSGKEIAMTLRLAESTVKSYRKSLYGKLGASRRSQALANARRMALIT